MARVLIAEPSLPISAALRKFLESAGHEVAAVHSVAAALEAVQDQEPQLAVIAASENFDGEALCGRVRALKPGCPVVLVYGPEETQPEARSERAGAEAFLVGPLKRPAVVAVSKVVLKLAGLTVGAINPAQIDSELKVTAQLHKALAPAKAREPKLLEAIARLNGELTDLKSREQPAQQRILALEDEAITLHAAVGKLQDQLRQAKVAGPGSQVAFLKRFLPLEVKRGKRYRYPLAVVLIGIDGLEQRIAASANPERQRAAIRAEAMAGIFKIVRDIDLTVPFADDKYLVLLPHTARDGALTVASRLQAQLSRMASFEGGTASVGVASFEPEYWKKKNVSFGGLLREATACLLRAQTNGGGYVDCAPNPDKPKRDRISIG